MTAGLFILASGESDIGRLIFFVIIAVIAGISGIIQKSRQKQQQEQAEARRRAAEAEAPQEGDEHPPATRPMEPAAGQGGIAEVERRLEQVRRQREQQRLAALRAQQIRHQQVQQENLRRFQQQHAAEAAARHAADVEPPHMVLDDAHEAVIFPESQRPRPNPPPAATRPVPQQAAPQAAVRRTPPPRRPAPKPPATRRVRNAEGEPILLDPSEVVQHPHTEAHATAEPPHPAAGIAGLLHDPENLRRAFVLKEILSAPCALRDEPSLWDD